MMCRDEHPGAQDDSELTLWQQREAASLHSSQAASWCSSFPLLPLIPLVDPSIVLEVYFLIVSPFA